MPHLLLQPAAVGARAFSSQFPAYVLNAPATEVATLPNGLRVASEVRASVCAGGWLVVWWDMLTVRGVSTIRVLMARPPPLVCSSMPVAATRPLPTTARHTSWST